MHCELLAGPFYLFELTPAITIKPDVQWLRQVRAGHVAHSGAAGHVPGDAGVLRRLPPAACRLPNDRSTCPRPHPGTR